MNNYREKLSLENRKLNTNTKDGDALSSSTTPSLVFAVISAVCTLPLPLLLWDSPMSELISLIVCMICAACVVMCTKRLLFSVIAIAIASLLVSVAGSTVPCAYVFAPICSIAFGSAAIARKKGGGVLSALFIAISSLAISLIITGSLLSSALSLITLPTAVVLGICNRRRLQKTSATIAGTVCIALTAISVIALAIYSGYGTISVEAIREAANDLGYTLSDYTEKYFSAIGNAVTPELHLAIAEISDSFINSFLGTVVALSFTGAYICQSMSLAAAERLGENVSERIHLTASLVTSLVFIGAYLISFTTSASGKVAFAAVVANNIAVMLTPCLFIIGIRSIKLMPFKLGLIGLLASVAVIIIMFLPSSSALTVLALTGALFTVVENIDAWAKEHYSKGESNE